jgi:hypothetical protein
LQRIPPGQPAAQKHRKHRADFHAGKSATGRNRPSLSSAGKLAFRRSGWDIGRGSRTVPQAHRTVNAAREDSASVTRGTN